LSNAPAYQAAGIRLEGIPETAAASIPAKAVSAPEEIPEIPQFARNKWGTETSNIVLIRSYPPNGTLQGLVELGRVGNDSPVGGVIIGNDVDDYAALLWYQDEISSERVAIHLQSRGWSVDFAVCAESKSDIPATEDEEHRDAATEDGVQEPQVEAWMLVVDGLEWNFPLERIKEAVRQRFPFVSFHRKGKRSRTSSKHAARFIWPVSHAIPGDGNLAALQLGNSEVELWFEPR